MFNYSFTANSSNKKTGNMPITRTDKRSCPDSCILKTAGCYAKSGPVFIHWKKLDSIGLSLKELAQKIKSLPNKTLWRHNEAGDLPGQNDKIDRDSLQVLIDANRGKKGYTYTHYPLNDDNVQTLTHANQSGFTINISCNNVAELEAIKGVNLPKVVILPLNAPPLQVVNGQKIMVCPAQLKESMTCTRCKLCQVVDRKMIIGFKAHGTQKKIVNVIAG